MLADEVTAHRCYFSVRCQLKGIHCFCFRLHTQKVQVLILVEDGCVLVCATACIKKRIVCFAFWFNKLVFPFSKGGMALSVLVPSTLQILCTIARDSKVSLHRWALHGLWLTTEAAGLAFVPHVQVRIWTVFMDAFDVSRLYIFYYLFILHATNCALQDASSFNFLPFNFLCREVFNDYLDSKESNFAM